MAKRTHWLTWGGLLALALFGPGLLQLASLSVQQWRLDRRLAALSAERTRLSQEQQRLESDPTYVEGLIRSTFKWAKPGEYVVPLEPPSGERPR